MRWVRYFLPLALLVAINIAPSKAQPLVGWQTELSQELHNVSGTVTIYDEDTLLFDDFSYDGGGLLVYFYLGTADDDFAFTNGLEIGPQLVGSVFDGTQDPFFVDLPDGQTMDGWNAISVWCVIFNLNFGSGTFSAPITVPEPTSAVLLALGLSAVLCRRNALRSKRS